MIAFSEVANATGLVIACDGDLDLKDLYEAKKSLAEGHPRIASWYFGLVDLSAVAHLEVTAPDFDRLVEQDRKIAQLARPGIPVAIIARTELPFGISRMWESATDFTGWETHVFRDRAPAEAWLRQRVLALYDVELEALA